MTRIFQSHLAMLGFSVLVAGSFSFGSIIANDISPIALTAVRFILAAVVIGIITIATGSVTQAALKSPWRYLILGGVFSVYFVLMFEGLKTATPVSTVAIFTLIPAVSAIAGFVILGQIVSSRIVVALIIGALGALWVIFRGDIYALSTLSIGRGELVYFVGCIAHALMPILFRLLSRGENPLMVTFGLLTSGAMMLCVFGAREIIETEWISLPMIVWVAIFYLSICASAVTFVLLQFASMHLPATNVMAYTYLTPIWVLVWELLLGHDVPNLWVLGGVFLAVLSLMLLLRTSLEG